jgi:hypothetical protein
MHVPPAETMGKGRAPLAWALLACLLLLSAGSAGVGHAQDSSAHPGEKADTASAPSPDSSPQLEGPPDEPYRPPESVAVRSLVIPGWGQQVNGQKGKGWFLTSMAVVGVLLGTETIQLNVLTGGRTQNNLERDLGWFMYGGSVVWATIDGYLVAQNLNRENGYDLAHWPGPPPSPGVQLTLVRLDF